MKIHTRCIMDRYIKCIRETATDITPGRVYRLI
jgi:hypothetical protein